MYTYLVLPWYGDGLCHPPRSILGCKNLQFYHWELLFCIWVIFCSPQLSAPLPQHLTPQQAWLCSLSFVLHWNRDFLKTTCVQVIIFSHTWCDFLELDYSILLKIGQKQGENIHEAKNTEQFLKNYTASQLKSSMPDEMGLGTQYFWRHNPCISHFLTAPYTVVAASITIFSVHTVMHDKLLNSIYKLLWLSMTDIIKVVLWPLLADYLGGSSHSKFRNHPRWAAFCLPSRRCCSSPPHSSTPLSEGCRQISLNQCLTR